MSDSAHPKTKQKAKPKPKPSRAKEAKRLVQEEIDHQRATLEELRRKMN
ncbi:hypothetical protein [Bradyrhizobium sp. Bra64]|nr:hypothetical protein [Bradyrhizobium sp. Bra64]